MSDATNTGTRIHPTAIVDAGAEIDCGAEIGPYAVVGPRVRIGAGTQIAPHVIVESDTEIGRDCRIFAGVALGGPPQDTKYEGERTSLVIGDRNVLREYVTIHRATGEGESTRLGDDNFLMTYAHVGHNCVIGSHVTLASYVGVSGHVLIEDYVTCGGLVGIHQYSRIGTMSMVSALSGVSMDVPPYMLVNGRPARVVALNSVGLRRNGVSPEARRHLREACKLLYLGTRDRVDAIERIKEQIPDGPEIRHLIEFAQASREGRMGRANSPTHADDRESTEE